MQNWTFFRLFPVMHSECHGIKNSPVWALIIFLREIIQLVHTSKLSQSHIFNLKALLEDCMQERVNVFSEVTL